jgi:hypothetical protein
MENHRVPGKEAGYGSDTISAYLFGIRLETEARLFETFSRLGEVPQITVAQWGKMSHPSAHLLLNLKVV